MIRLFIFRKILKIMKNVKTDEMHDIQTSFRLTKSMFDRIETLKQAMINHSIGIEVERTKVIRLAMERGLTSLEFEIGLKK